MRRGQQSSTRSKRSNTSRRAPEKKNIRDVVDFLQNLSDAYARGYSPNISSTDKWPVYSRNYWDAARAIEEASKASEGDKLTDADLEDTELLHNLGLGDGTAKLVATYAKNGDYPSYVDDILSVEPKRNRGNTLLAEYVRREAANMPNMGKAGMPAAIAIQNEPKVITRENYKDAKIRHVGASTKALIKKYFDSKEERHPQRRRSNEVSSNSDDTSVELPPEDEPSSSREDSFRGPVPRRTTTEERPISNDRRPFSGERTPSSRANTRFPRGDAGRSQSNTRSVPTQTTTTTSVPTQTTTTSAPRRRSSGNGTGKPSKEEVLSYWMPCLTSIYNNQDKNLEAMKDVFGDLRAEIGINSYIIAVDTDSGSFDLEEFMRKNALKIRAELSVERGVVSLIYQESPLHGACVLKITINQ